MTEVYLCYYEVLDRYYYVGETRHSFITKSKAVAEEYQSQGDVDYGDYLYRHLVECFELQ